MDEPDPTLEANSNTARAAWALAVCALMAWGLHWLWGPALPPGVDVTGHLTRLDVGLDLFSSWRLDGWFDRAMLGYQTFLIYGPGLAFAVALMRTLTFGLLSTPGALEVVAVVSLVALAPAAASLTRAFGLSVRAGRVAGLLALAVSSPRGGGIEGAFDLGLLPNTLAAPLVLWAWALALSRRPRPLLLAVVAVGIGITHPQSLVIFVGFLPLVLAAGWAAGVVDRSCGPTLLRAGLIGAGLGAWWWLPAFVHRDLRGLLTSWDLPSLADHLGLMLHGERGWVGPAALLVALVWLVALVHSAVRRDLREYALVALPIAALASLHLAEWALVDRVHEVVLLPNRGLTYAAYLAVPVVGLVIDRTFSRWGSIPWIATAVVVALTLPALRPPTGAFDRPSDDLRATATSLAAEVPDGYRFAFVYAPGSQAGVPAMGRWLGWTSGRSDLGPFGAEYAPGVSLTLLVFDPPDHTSVNEWISQVRALSVSHIVTGEPDSTEVFATSGLVEVAARHGDLTIWELTQPPIFEVVAAAPDRIEWDVDLGGQRQLPLPVGWSPGWTASVDGEQVAATSSPDGRLSIPYEGGAHRVQLRFDLPSGFLLGRAITVATLVALVLSSRVRGRRGPGRRSPAPLRPTRSDGWPDLR